MVQFFGVLFMALLAAGCAKEKSKVSIKAPARVVTRAVGDHVLLRNIPGAPDSSVDLNQLASDMSAMDSSTCAELPEIALHAASQTLPSLQLGGGRLSRIKSFRISSIGDDGRRLHQIRSLEKLKIEDSGFPVIELNPNLGGLELLHQPRRFVFSLFSGEQGTEAYEGCLLVSTRPIFSTVQIHSVINRVNWYFDRDQSELAGLYHALLQPVAQVVFYNPNRIAVTAQVIATGKHLASGSVLSLWHVPTASSSIWHEMGKVTGVNQSITVPAQASAYVSFYGGSFEAPRVIAANRGIEIQWSATAMSPDGSMAIGSALPQPLTLH